jgi:hypothetical protein
MSVHIFIEVRNVRMIRITLPQELLTKIDRTVAELDTNRSGFALQAFEDALFRLWVAKLGRTLCSAVMCAECSLIRPTNAAQP